MGQIKGSPGRRTASTKATDLSDAAKWDPWPEASKGMQTPTRHSQKAVAFTEHPHNSRGVQVYGHKGTGKRQLVKPASLGQSSRQRRTCQSRTGVVPIFLVHPTIQKDSAAAAELTCSCTAADAVGPA